MANKWTRSSEALIEQFYRCMENFSNIEKRKMFGYPCYFVNNNMFTGLHEENWIIRLDEEDRKELIDSYSTTQFEPMKGRPMREYVILPQVISSNHDLLQKWIKRSLDFASSLPPKVAKKRKKLPKKNKVAS